MLIKRLIIFGILFCSNIGFAENLDAPTPQIQQLLRRISMLESALAPTNPQAVAKAWAEATKNRNGAVQYMLLCPSLQKVNLANLEALNWVTGISSPWISSYKVEFRNKEGNVSQFFIQYQFTDGGKETWKAIDYINIIHVDRQRVEFSNMK